MAATVRELAARLNDTRIRLGALGASAEALQRQHVQLNDQVVLARTRVNMAPRVQQMLEALQASAHARTIGAYEAILTGLVHDVMGPETGVVRMATSQRNGQPALDVDIVRDGKPEDILEGNGGALTNVVCAGLRFAVIARSGLRRFLVLDEPDCWLRPDRVPVFFRALAAVCDQAGFQAVVVSHHPVDPEQLPDTVSYVNLSLAGGRVVAENKVCAAPTSGLTHLWAQNLRRHEDTFMRFGPGLTLLSGPNNLGKSALIGGLRAIACGGAQDGQINHDADEMRVEVGFINNGEAHRIALTRKRKGNPRVVLQHLSEADDELHVERGAPSAAPAWVESLLGVHDIESMNPQLLGQKTPVFLLDQSASMRARLLYAGREAAYLARMFEEQNRQLREDKKTIGRGTLTLDSLGAQIARLEEVPEFNDRASALVTMSEALSEADSRLRQISALLPRMTAAVSRASLAVPSPPDAVPALRDTQRLALVAKQLDLLSQKARAQPPAGFQAPQLRPTESLVAIAQRIATAKRITELPSRVGELPTAPVLKEVGALVVVAAGLRRATAAVSSLARLPEPARPPELRNATALGGSVRTLATMHARLHALAQEEHAAEKALALAKAEIQQLIEATGHTCPLCHQAMTPEHLHVA